MEHRITIREAVTEAGTGGTDLVSGERHCQPDGLLCALR